MCPAGTRSGPRPKESPLAAPARVVATEAPAGFQHPATAYEILPVLGTATEQAVPSTPTSVPRARSTPRGVPTARRPSPRTAPGHPSSAARRRTCGCLASPVSRGAPPKASTIRWTRGAAHGHLPAAARGGGRPQPLARDNGGRLPVPVWFLLDECGNIPHIPGMGTKLTVAAGWGIHFLRTLQGPAQLKQYGDASQTMTCNCDTWLFLRTADVETAKVISAKLGTFAVRTSSHSIQSGSVSGPHTQSEGATARPLRTPDEALRWPSGHSLLIQSGEHPADMPPAGPRRLAIRVGRLPAGRSSEVTGGRCGAHVAPGGRGF